MTKNKEDPKKWITSDMYVVTDRNCHTLLEKKGITQRQLALAIGVSEGIVSNYVNCETSRSFPSINFLLGLQKKYGISIEEFITKELTAAQITPELTPSEYEENELAAYSTYCGVYYCYYLDTSKYKGRDYNSDEDALLYGIVFIYRDRTATETMRHSCIAILDFRDPVSVKNSKDDLSSKFDDKNVSEFWNYIDGKKMYNNHAYYGEFELNSTSAFLSLRHKDKDRALVILHRVPGKGQTYLGGIGTINSVSRGREPMPVVQFIGLSREFLCSSVEEIHHNLQLNYPSFKDRESAKSLLQKFKDLYTSPDNQFSSYSDFDKELVIIGNLNSSLREILKKNTSRYSKVSNRDDDEWYHFIKENCLKSIGKDDILL